MTNPLETECIICKSPIRRGAKKCIACNSRQDWLRYFDIGNTAVPLLIALLSLAALVSSNFFNVLKFFADNESPRLSAQILDITPESLVVLFDNDGPGFAVVSGSICLMNVVKDADKLYNLNSRDHLEGFTSVRYPRPNEVAGRYMYSYEVASRNPVVIDGTKSLIVRFILNEMRPDLDQRMPKEKETISYCSFGFFQENGVEDGVFVTINPIWVASFSLDQPYVQKVIKRHKKPNWSEPPIKAN